MSEIKDGGPAFAHGDPTNGGDPGMSLRDWFAGQATVGLLAHPQCKPVGPGYEVSTACVAREAFAIADAMLAAREAGQ